MSREGEESADSAHVTLPPPRAPAVETGRGEAARRGDGCTRGGEFRWAAGAGQGRGLAAGGGAGRGLVGESAGLLGEPALGDHRSCPTWAAP